MVVRVAERAQASGASSVLVATDDERIASVCVAYGVPCEMTSNAHRTGTERIVEVVGRKGYSEDTLVVNVQGDEPFIEPALIARVAEELTHRFGVEMATAACPITDRYTFLDPSAVKVVRDAAGCAMYFSRAPIPFGHALPAMTLRHLGLYAYRVGFLQRYAQLSPCPMEATESLEQLRVLWHGYRIAVAVVADVAARGVDTREDLARARQRGCWSRRV